MRLIVADTETFWSQEHSLSKMNPMAYCVHPETEIISVAIKIEDEPTQCYMGEDEVRKAVSAIDWSDSMLVFHNGSGFDAMIWSWRLGVNPKMWGCTLAMARPIHSINVGNSLAKLVAHYNLGVKDNTALINTKGRHLKDFTAQEVAAMKMYNKADVDQCYALFKKLKPYYSAKELWHIDATIRQLVEPQFELNTPMLQTALTAERNDKSAAVLTLAEHLNIEIDGDIGAVEEQVTGMLASAAKFSEVLRKLRVEVPMKPSPTNPGNAVPALAKTDEGFLSLMEHDDPVVSAAARARLAVKSTLLETRIKAFATSAKAAGGALPIPINYCGAFTTGRDSGWAYNPQNLPRVNPKSPKNSDALRYSMKAPAGYKVVVADLSGIELRVNHFLWKVQSTMDLYKADPAADLYRAAGAIAYNKSMEEITKDERQIEKIKALGLGFGAGAATFVRIAKLMGGMDITLEQSKEWVDQWRAAHAPIVQGWKTCGAILQDIYDGVERDIDPWGLCKTHEHGIVLPSGRMIRYPKLHVESGGTWPDGRTKTSWVYGEGRYRTFISGPKVDENIVQALARDILKDYKLQVFLQTGYRSALDVHDELVYLVPEDKAQDHLDTVQHIMRTAPAWWSNLITWSEGSVGNNYGEAK